MIDLLDHAANIVESLIDLLDHAANIVESSSKCVQLACRFNPKWITFA
jgi:hypothetical protein